MGKPSASRTGQPDDREVEQVAGRPSDSRDARGREVELPQQRCRKAIAQCGQGLFRGSHSRSRHIGVGSLGEVSLVLVGTGEILMKVGSKPDLAVVDTLELVQQNDTVAVHVAAWSIGQISMIRVDNQATSGSNHDE
jgi:hypothetical protein